MQYMRTTQLLCFAVHLCIPALSNALGLMLILPFATPPREQLQFCQLSHILIGATDGFIQSQSQTVI